MTDLKVKSYCKKVIGKLIADLKKYSLPIVIIAVYMLLANLIFGYCCPSRILFGKLCPGCGLTRSCLCILRLDFKEAYEYNPAGFAWFSLIVYAFVIHYLTDKKPRFLTPLLVIVCLVTILQWIILGRYK